MILSPANWNAVLAPERPWQEAYAAVGEEVKRIFSSPGVTGRVSTNDLAELLYPEKWARDAGIKARKRLFKALAALADHDLKDYCERGEPRPMKNQPGKIIRPLIWRKPEERTLARVIFEYQCPGVRWTEQDRPAYEAAAEAARKVLNG